MVVVVWCGSSVEGIVFIVSVVVWGTVVVSVEPGETAGTSEEKNGSPSSRSAFVRSQQTTPR